MSDQELSNQGWEQLASLLVYGAPCIGLFGLCLVAAGMFVTNPGSVDPPSAALKGALQT